jgi:hypothetical protein
MENKYLHETFHSGSSDFDQRFTQFLNDKHNENWKVKHCSYCHDSNGSEMWASCLFKKKS